MLGVLLLIIPLNGLEFAFFEASVWWGDKLPV